MKEALKDIGETASRLVRDGQAIMLFLVVYLALMATIALFVSTREATIPQVLLTFAMLIAAPALFFLLQAMCISYSESTGISELMHRSVRSSWKVILASIPLIVFAVILYLLLGKIEARVLAPAQQLQHALPGEAAKAEWSHVIFLTLRLLLCGFMLPLASIHIWTALRRDDVSRVVRGIGPIIARAFAPRSVITYLIGLILFAALPYVLIVLRTPVERAWVELALVSARLGLAFCFMLFGWVITVGALQRGIQKPGMPNEELYS